MRKVFIVGTVGIPAKYGGFETLVENIIHHKKSSEIEYYVYNSSKSYKDKIKTYEGANLIYLPLRANGVQSIFYDILSLIHAAKKCDVILVLGLSGCSFLPVFRVFCKKKIIINVDGIEHKRQKWGKWTKKFLYFSEKMAFKYGNIIIADNKGIEDYANQVYHKKTELIAYGGDHVLVSVSDDEKKRILSEYELTEEDYSCSICRIEPENNIHLILEAFSRRSDKKLVFIGNWENSNYGKKLLEQYSLYDNIKMLSPIYDKKILFVIRACSEYYIHGHSVGGTNPSLVEAMFFNKPIIAFDVIYNRETTENKACYFDSPQTLLCLLDQSIKDKFLMGANMNEISHRRYKWSFVAGQYESLFLSKI